MAEETDDAIVMAYVKVTEYLMPDGSINIDYDFMDGMSTYAVKGMLWEALHSDWDGEEDE